MPLSTVELNRRLEEAAKQIECLRQAARELAAAGDEFFAQRRRDRQTSETAAEPAVDGH